MSRSGKGFPYFSGLPSSGVSWLGALALVVTWAGLPGHAWSQGLPISSGRKLAPDALQVIPPGVDYDDTYQGPVDLPYVAEHPELAWTPNYLPENETLLEMGKNIVFRGRAYGLEFAFKPVRMIELDVQTPSGPQQKLVWYMIYRVRYLGGDLQPKAEPDQYNNMVFGTPEAVSDKWVRFIPAFTLEAKGPDKSYMDRVMPEVIPAIAARERVALSEGNRQLAKLHDSIEIQQMKIERTTEAEDNSVWGVATWVNVDPKTNFFSVEVRGLTNAQKIELNGDELTTRQQTLVLHFWLPGDEVNELEDRIRFGIPALSDPQRQEYVLQRYGVQERLDHMWVYR